MAATHKSLRNGNWSDPTMWDAGTVPAGGAIVRVDHEVIYDTKTPTGAFTRAQIETMRREQDTALAEAERMMLAPFAIEDIFVSPTGAFKFSNSVETFLLVETMWIEGVFECGTESAPIPFAATPSLPQAEILLIGLADPGASMKLGILSDSAERIRWWGEPKTPGVKLAAQAMTGATTLTLASVPSNWHVGDEIVLQGTDIGGNTNVDPHYTGPSSYWGPKNGNGKQSIENDKDQYFGNDFWVSHDEPLTITAINGAQITFTPALVHDHIIRTQTLHDGQVKTLAPYVENLTRPIQVTGFCTHEKGAGANRRAHTMDMFGDNIVRHHVRFRDLGRTRTDATLYIPEFNFETFGLSSAATSGFLADPTNVRGRYPIHNHWCGITRHGLAVVDDGVVIDSTPGCGRVPGPMYIQHHSRCFVHNSICYRGRASGFATETGSEIGQWWNCSAMDFAGDGFFLNAFGDRAELIPNHDGHTGVAFNNQARSVVDRKCRGSSARLAFAWVQQKPSGLWNNASPHHTAMRVFCPITNNMSSTLGGSVYGLDNNYGHQQAQIPDFNDNQFIGCNNFFRASSRDNWDSLDVMPMVARGNMCLANTPYNIPQYSHQYYNIDWAMWGDGTGNAVNIGTKTFGHSFVNCGAVGFGTFIRSVSLNYNGELAKIAGDWSNLDALYQNTLESGPDITAHDQHDMYNMVKVGEVNGNAIVVARTHINYGVDTALPSPYPGLRWRNADPEPGLPTPRFYDETGTQHTRTITQNELQGVQVAGTIVDGLGTKWWPSYARFNAPASGGNDPKKPTRSNSTLIGADIVRRNGWYQDGPDKKCRLWFYDADRLTGEPIEIGYTVTLAGEWDQDLLDAHEVADANATRRTHFPSPLATWDYSDENVIETKVGPLAFDPVSSALVGSMVGSAPELISRLDRGQTSPITILGGEYRINGGAWTSQAGVVRRLDQIELRAQVPAPNFTNRAVLTVNGGTQVPFDLTGAPTYDQEIWIDFSGGSSHQTQVRDGKTWNDLASNGTFPVALVDASGAATGLSLNAPTGLYGSPAANGPTSAIEGFDDQSLESCWSYTAGSLTFDLINADPAKTYDFEFVGHRGQGQTSGVLYGYTVEGQQTVPFTVNPDNNTTISNEVTDIYPDGSNQLNVVITREAGSQAGVAAMRIGRNTFPNPKPITLPATLFQTDASFTLAFSQPDPTWTLTGITGLPAGWSVDLVAGTISYDGSGVAGSYSFTATQTHPSSPYSPFTNTFAFELADVVPVETITFPYSANLNPVISDAALAVSVNSFRTDQYVWNATHSAAAVEDDNNSNDEAEAVAKPSFLELQITAPPGAIVRGVSLDAARPSNGSGFSVRTNQDSYAASLLSVDIASLVPSFTSYAVTMFQAVPESGQFRVRLYLWSTTSQPSYFRNLQVQVQLP